MTKIAILTDSTANLPMEWVEQYNVRVIPLKIHWGDETYLDGIDLTPNEFYTRLAHAKSLPTTSQPSIQDFLQVFESLADQADGIVVPLISSGISGTVASAQAAARQFTRVPVEIIDTPNSVRADQAKDIYRVLEETKVQPDRRQADGIPDAKKQADERLPADETG